MSDSEKQEPEFRIVPVWEVEGGPTRKEAIEAAGAIIAAGDLAMESMTPREQAEAAWTPTSRFTFEQLEDRIRARRGLPALDRGGKS